MTDDKKQQNITTYKIEDKSYTVITKYIENAANESQLYNVICEYIISQINE